MPPKNARKPNIKEDIVELQSQLKALNEDVQLIYGTVNVIESAIKKILEAQEEQHEKTMSMFSDFIEKSRPTTAIGESGGCNETNHTPSTKKVIPAPRVYKEVEGKTKGFTLKIVKDHIVQYVIKEANKELTDPEAEAQYQTMHDELNIALNVLESRVKKAITDTTSEEDRYEYQSDESIVDMKGYTWGSRSLARFRDIAIRSFEDMVLEATGVDLSVCESHWASSHMLEETWNNCRILTYQSSIVYRPFHLSLCYIRSFISTSTTAQLSIGLFTGLCVSETLIWVQTSRRTIHVNSVSA
ncbi:hypothetical protein BJV82DRAFT_664516 [Fennellomyces sp. T-0311]|nr:hypothetical protein BJV82DRAFT_664516 [Fennellomyces sp. T-0311]